MYISRDSPAIRAIISCSVFVAGLAAQTAPGPDVLLLKDGEKFIGHLRSATGAKVVFVSDAAGPVTIEWSKVQELHSNERFAAVLKDAAIHGKSDSDKAPTGTVAVNDQKLEVTAKPDATPRTVPVSEISHLMTEEAFNGSFGRDGFFHGWNGAASLNTTILQGTATNRQVNTSLNLTRTDPPVSWLPKKTTTSVGFNYSYGSITAIGETVPTKTELLQASLEQDFYLTPRTFLLAGASFEHNYTQGLDLTQAYGGGVGYLLVNKERDQLSLRAGLGFMYQQWVDSALNRKLLGARFGVSYAHTFAHSVVFQMDAGVRPALNYERAFFGGFVSSLTVPVYRRFEMNVNAIESFVYNPPPGFKKNLFQISIGATYVIR